MAENKNTLREWSEKLETGERDDELLAVAAQLERAGQTEPSAPSVEFRRQLRRDLLNQYATTTERSGSRFRRLAGSVAAIGLLAVIVVTAWLSMSSAGRMSSGGAPAMEGAATPTIAATLPAAGVAPTPVVTPTLSPSGYTFLVFSVSSGLIIGMAGPGNAGNQAPIKLVPGQPAEIVTRWSVPADAGQATLFSLHLLDSEGQIISQADAPVQTAANSAGQTAEAILIMDIPADLTPGEYEMGGGLFDAATGARLSFETLEGEAQWIIRADAVVTEETNAGTARLSVTDVQPAAGTVLSGTTPIPFRIELAYDLVDMPSAYLEVRVVESLPNGSGRGVGLAAVDLLQESGTLMVELAVDPSELAGATNLNLLLQLKPDVTSAPIVGEMPAGIRWRYEP